MEHVISSDSPFRLNTSSRDRGINPYPYFCFRSPNIVNVFPEPVCPYVKTVEFSPLRKASICLPATEEKIYDCTDVLLKIPSKEYLFYPSSIIEWSYLMLAGCTAGLNLQNTRTLCPSPSFSILYVQEFSSIVV